VKEYLTKICMFMFLVAIISGRTNELGVVTGALTGTILLWPLYRKFVPAPKRRRIVVVDEESETPVESTPESAMK
jgi:multisubunit Na+/H+ antiporter MnhE subunit